MMEGKLIKEFRIESGKYHFPMHMEQEAIDLP